ncbi:MAG TPA: cell envelope biogenesis protein TolA, partial [Rhizomicrobium sp.]|nr:cell envelope biogenesis protein TolA [Rhizomicrobium sp.]
TNDAAIVKAAMARPGIVLRRPVGTGEPFQEDAALPAGFALPSVKEAPALKTKKAQEKKAQRPAKTAERKTSPAAIISFEKARAERERARAKEDAAARREAEKRSSAVEKAQAALDDAREDHQARRDKLTRELDRRIADEEARWTKTRARLEAALEKARKS